MPNKSRLQASILLATLSALVLAALIWYGISRSDAQTQSNDPRLIDAIDPADPPPKSRPRRQTIELASIPWKRDCDVFQPVFLPTAQLPWHQ